MSPSSAAPADRSPRLPASAPPTSLSTPSLIVAGPAGHGVSDYARDLADRVVALDPSTRVARTDGLDQLTAALAAVPRAHLNVTDKILGTSPEDAAENLERLAASTPLTLTLHDLPQTSDGERNLPRRRAAYARFVAAAHGVVVSSEHEGALFEQFLATVDPALPRPRVIPLGTRPGAPFDGSGTGRRHDGTADTPAAATLTVVIAGFVYPGKGHVDAIEAAGLLGRRLGEAAPHLRVLALGAASRGHDDDVDRLREHAARLGVAFEITGHLDDDAYERAFRQPGVPLVAHRHFSASRSLLDWAEQGRRALVIDGRYTREAAALRPGTIELYDGDDPAVLADHLDRAWRDPRTTRLAAGTTLAPTLDDVAAEHVRWWRDDVAW
ncbi:hypothetical protein ACPEEZ_02895 [Frigoribacterium sp. 2-23]|uniref:hypothetical protein n=1 Tax=Frigoribacterium sp. 2-23 TaxID=3415006 RepID=UPI003C703237